MEINKQLYSKVAEDYKKKLQSADDVLFGDYINEAERKAKLKEIIDMLELFNNNIYMLDGYHEPIDLSLPADNGEDFGTKTMKEDLEKFYGDDKKIRDIYFQYWLLVNDDKYLEPIINYTNMKIGFLFNCLYLDEESEYITIDGTEYHKSYFFMGPASSDIISRLKFLVTTFRAIYEKFSVTIRKYVINPRYINASKDKLLSVPAFYGDDETMNEEFIMGNLLELLDHFFYIRAILLKKEQIYAENRPEGDLILVISDLLEECNYKYKNLVNAFYKTSHYLVDYFINKIDTSELLRVTISKLYFMIDAIAELRRKEKLTKDDLINALELKREILYTSLDMKVDENYPLRKLEELLDRFMQEIIMLISEKIEARFEQVSNRIRSELGERYKYVEGSAFKSLATAEYLYEIMVATGKPDPKMDYSCISILYYKALEDSLNKLIYKPYHDRYLVPEISKWDGRSNIVFDYLPYYLPPKKERRKAEEDALNRIKKYYFKYDNYMKDFIPVKVLTLGSFEYLLDPRNTPEKLQAFLNDVIKDWYKSCRALSKDISEIKDNRNNAAHGGNIIHIDQVKEDKAHIYTLEEASLYKRLLLRFLDMLI